jgi:predicted amidophosphoribosyltransferase
MSPQVPLRGRWQPISDAVDDYFDGLFDYEIPPSVRLMRAAKWQPDSPDQWCHRCGGSIGPSEVWSDAANGRLACSGCSGSPAVADHVLRLGRWEGILKTAVAGIKFHAWWEMSDLLGKLMGQAVLEYVGEPSGPWVVVPMPVPWTRRKMRGIDHAYCLARSVASTLQAPLRTVLARKNGVPQAGLPAQERRKAPFSDIWLRRLVSEVVPPQAHLVVVDDVLTTGRTMSVACRHLQKLGPSAMTAIVAAVADRPGRGGGGGSGSGG